MIPEIHIEDYNYLLPDDRIAKYPLLSRDASNLLIYKEGNIEKHGFTEISEYLPEDALMVFNDTKVVPARLHFQRSTGAHIEIFCLEPVQPEEYVTMFAETESCRWKCIVGNVKRWKNDTLSLYNPLDDNSISEMNLKADLVEREGETSIVKFTWDNDAPFSHVLEVCGSVPIPPYLNRDTEEVDLERYQTLYARFRGSVAAPTAGLHFTEKVLEEIRAKGVTTETVCLHVGAGTFLPVKSSLVSEHTMHREPFVVTLALLEKLIARKGKVAAVGTTSVRTLESLYYVGVSCIEKGCPEDVGQWDPYSREYAYSTEEALHAIVKYLKDNGLSELKVGTRIIIVPGFSFRIVDMLITNFHQPQSTLLLLISAFMDGNWKQIYDFALENGFRFLSYGDSSLLFRAVSK
ncbi:MAG: S-adenosylmethionine:tRNA ribosyltransferase-isomerase [Bacteroidales bacterium]|nr:S-adenosylmethionine:tRNA ribosyltransferase-isomerase [Bacteroidales bacterium]MBR5300018.1 S-adenosylmethionine:tRNA ribosyltransferase-isomerase [Bacteroidales bacterium]